MNKFWIIYFSSMACAVVMYFIMKTDYNGRYQKLFNELDLQLYFDKKFIDDLILIIGMIPIINTIMIVGVFFKIVGFVERNSGNKKL